MARRVLIALAVGSFVASAGCIIPTPLEHEQQTTQFPAPVIVTDPDASPTTPALGPLVVLANQYIDLDIEAEDANENLPFLYSRLFAQPRNADGTYPQSITWLGAEVALEKTNTQFRYHGTYAMEGPCAQGVGALLWVIVADQPFDQKVPTAVQMPGQFDQKSWEVLGCK